MPATILATKLYLPPPRPNAVLRPRLLDLLNDGLAANHRLTLISAPAGYGKTALVSAWVASSHRPTAWLSLDEADSDPTRFLSYLIAALQTVAPQVGTGLANVLSSPQPPSTEAILTALLNELAAVPDPFTLVLDDYHVLDSSAVDAALAFLIGPFSYRRMIDRQAVTPEFRDTVLVLALRALGVPKQALTT